MNNDQKIYAQKLKDEYSKRQDGDLKTLKELDKKVKTPALVTAYTVGIVGALTLGLGMCLAMKVICDLPILGIIIGLLGIAIVSVNYPLFNAILRSRKKKYAEQIISLSNKILNND